MIIKDGNESRFNYRIAGIAIYNDRVLLHQTEGDTFWTCPGGRGEIGEKSERTLIREMEEEIKARVEVIRLLWFVENFFKYSDKEYHEVALYYLMKFSGESEKFNGIDKFSGIEEGTRLNYEWFPIKKELLRSLPLLPSFLQNRLDGIPTNVEHVVHYD